MSALETFTINYHGKEYPATIIPHIFINKSEEKIIIGAHSLNVALYDEDQGYPDDEAQFIDEKIYAFMDDDFFYLGYEDFLDKARKYLD